ITNPNVQLENQRNTKELFQVKYSFDLYKRVGKEKSFILSENVRLVLNDVNRERSVIPTVATKTPLDADSSLKRLNGMPDGTKIEVFIVFNEPLKTEMIDTMRSQNDLDILWRAV